MIVEIKMSDKERGPTRAMTTEKLNPDLLTLRVEIERNILEFSI